MRRKKTFSGTIINQIKIPSHVTKICEKAFFDCKNLNTIEFSDNSELEIIERHIFDHTLIKSFTIPKNVYLLKNGWNKSDELKEIKIAEGSKNSKYFDDDVFIVGKSNPENDDYDELIFARKDVKYATNPSFIKRICPFSFYKSNVKNVTIPSNVEEIGLKAFYECEKLKLIKIPKDSKLRSIGKLAFSGCLIYEIFIPASVVELKDGCLTNLGSDINISENKSFKYCNDIKDLSIIGKTDPNNDEFDMLVYINENCETLSFPIKKIAPYTFIKSSINSIECMPEEIGEKSFAHTFSLREINLTLCKNIGKKAFIYSGIQHIEIPPFVTEIKESTFSERKLSTIKFSGDSQLKKIGISAFKNSKIKSIEIPKGVTEIAETAFVDCKELQEIKFSENSELVIIKENAFKRSSIRSIKVPKGVKKICANAFKECLFLEKITFYNDSALEIIGSNAFYRTSIKEITIPPHVKEISDQAFFMCEQLKINEEEDDKEKDDEEEDDEEEKDLSDSSDSSD